MRDYQKQKCYDWQNKFIHIRDTQEVEFENIQNIINYIWKEMRLEFPPLLNFSNKKNIIAEGNRHKIIWSNNHKAYTWLICHELAHSMTDAGHGPKFVGMYMKLLEKFVGIPMPYLHYTAKQMKLDWDIWAKPEL